MPRLGVPSTAAFRCTPRSGPGLLPPTADFVRKSVDLSALSRLSFNPSLTRKKGRKEGTWRTALKEGAKAPAVHAPARRRRHRLAGRLQGPQARPLLLPAGRHPRLHPGIHRFFQAAGRFRQGRDRCARDFGRSGQGPGCIQEEAQTHGRPALGRDATRCSRPMAPGARNPCTARPSWELFACTVLIGPDGRIARIWPKVRVDGHAEEVLAAAKAL